MQYEPRLVPLNSSVRELTFWTVKYPRNFLETPLIADFLNIYICFEMAVVNLAESEPDLGTCSMKQ